jgi:hypothetical protein
MTPSILDKATNIVLGGPDIVAAICHRSSSQSSEKGGVVAMFTNDKPFKSHILSRAKDELVVEDVQVHGPCGQVEATVG